MIKFTPLQIGHGAPLLNMVKEAFPFIVNVEHATKHAGGTWEGYRWCIAQFGQQAVTTLYEDAKRYYAYNPDAPWTRYRYDYFFKSEKDAILFKLHWC